MVLTVTYPDSAVNMAAYDKDFTAGRILADLNHSWETLCKLDPKFGYYPEAANYWFIFKGDFKDKVDNTFRDWLGGPLCPHKKKRMKTKVDALIPTEFLPAIAGSIKFSVKETLLALPPKLDEYSVPIFSEISDIEYSNSKLLTERLCSKIIEEYSKT